MKKILFILIFAALLSPLFLTAESVESEFYSVDLMVVSVASHPLGYKVVYYTRYAELKEAYLPLEWFQGTPDGKAEIVYGRSKTYPYLSLIYKNAKLHHLRLYVFDSQNHDSWGTISRQEDLTDEFSVDFDNFQIEF